MSITSISYHGAVHVEAEIKHSQHAQLGALHWMNLKLTNAPGMFGDKNPPDSFTIHFEPSALDKFTMLAEAIQHIFGYKTQEKTSEF